MLSRKVNLILICTIIQFNLASMEKAEYQNGPVYIKDRLLLNNNNPARAEAKNEPTQAVAVPMNDNIYANADLIFDTGLNHLPLEVTLMRNLNDSLPVGVYSLIKLYGSAISKEHWHHIVVLNGPVGTGKTTAAKFIAQSVGRPYLFVSGSYFSDQYQSSASANLRRFFSRLFALSVSQPYFLIIDEMNDLTDKPDENRKNNNQTGETFWKQLDECKKKNVSVIMTTNCVTNQRAAIARRIKRIIDFNKGDLRINRALLKFYLDKTSHDCTQEDIEQCIDDSFDLDQSQFETIVDIAHEMALFERNNDEIRIKFVHLANAIIEVNRMSDIQKEDFVKRIHNYIKDRHYAINTGLGIAQLATGTYFQFRNDRMQQAGIQIQQENLRIAEESSRLSRLINRGIWGAGGLIKTAATSKEFYIAAGSTMMILVRLYYLGRP